MLLCQVAAPPFRSFACIAMYEADSVAACPCRRAIAKAGAIPPLVALLGPGASEGCRQEAARALSNLSCNNEYNQGVSRPGLPALRCRRRC